MAFCSSQPISIADKMQGMGHGRHDGILSVIDSTTMKFHVTGFDNVIECDSSSWTDSSSETDYSSVMSESLDGGELLPAIPSLEGSPKNLKRDRTPSDQPAASGYAPKSKLHVDTPPVQSDPPSKTRRVSMVQSLVWISDSEIGQSETPLKSVTTIAEINNSPNNPHGGIETKASMPDIKETAGKATGTYLLTVTLGLREMEVCDIMLMLFG
jgi:hypothetical protein